MKKLFTFVLALMSVCAFAAREVVPTDEVLADYYDEGNVCVCIFVSADMACNDIVLTGSFNGWKSNAADCVHFEAVEGYDGWYVASYAPEANPDPSRGLEAKPIMLEADGSFNWEYQVGAATKVRGGVQVVQGTYVGEIDLINYGTDAPNVYIVDAWKNNPCTAIYHNYHFEVVSNGCDGMVVPYIIGAMNNWTFEQMTLDMERSLANMVPTYVYNKKMAEGTPYQIVSGLMNEVGEIEVAPAWEPEAYMQKLVDGVWVRIPGEDGANQLTHEDANIVWDLREADLRWARCPEAEDETPSDAVLANYYTPGDVCVCIYVPSELACYDIVLTGSFNGWKSTPADCVPFEPVAGYDGWYVASYTPEAEPDAAKGLQAKPVMLDRDGNFSWDYQVVDVTVVRGSVIAMASYLDEIDLINYGTDAPNVYKVDAWKRNPCDFVYRNYRIEVITDGCDGLAVPFIIGSMNNWSFEQMKLDEQKSISEGIPVYYYEKEMSEGTSYQIVSGLMDSEGQIVEEPDWNDKSLMQKFVDGAWVRFPGDDGYSLLTKEETDIVFDFRADNIRWARCAPAETAERVIIGVLLPTLNCPESVEIIGDFNDWNGTPMEWVPGNYWFAELEAKASQFFLFRSAGSWEQEILYNDGDNGWRIINDGELTFGQLWQDDTWQGAPCKMIELDLSNPNYFKWSGTAPQPVLVDVNCAVNYVDKNDASLSNEILTFHVPEAPVVEGFTFVGWEFVGGAMSDGLTIRAVYKPDSDPMGLPDEVQVPGNRAQKLVRNGNVYILKDDRTYTVQGQLVK